MWNEEELNRIHAAPSPALAEDMSRLDGDIMILGAGGKMGPTLAAMAQRAVKASGKKRRVFAVSRFGDPAARAFLTEEGVEMLSVDLNDEAALRRLPDAPNIIYMLGKKFGTGLNASETWHTNVVMPGQITKALGARRYVVFSTGNVYPYTDPALGGCREEAQPDPVGEYALTAWGRERVFEYAASHYGAEVLLLRLNYAIDLRYGILCDLANAVLSGAPVSLKVPYFNCVWQRYANEAALRALRHTSKDVEILNVTGDEVGCTRTVVTKLAGLLGREVRFLQDEGTLAMLMDPARCIKWFGRPDRSLDEMITLQAKWLLCGGRQLGKPTHFDEREGKF